MIQRYAYVVTTLAEGGKVNILKSDMEEHDNGAWVQWGLVKDQLEWRELTPACMPDKSHSSSIVYWVEGAWAPQGACEYYGAWGRSEGRNSIISDGEITTKKRVKWMYTKDLNPWENKQ